MPLNDFIERLQGITGEGTRETDFRLMQSQRAKQYQRALQGIRDQAARNVQFNAYAVPGQSSSIGGVQRSRGSSGGDISNPSSSYMYPLKGNLRVTSPYGVNRKGHKQAHSGIDWGAKSGTSIFAPANARVRSTAYDKVYGNQTILDLGGGRSMMFGHQSGFTVKPGQTIKAGQLIGYVGSTGWSTGPHLHFETWMNNKPVNPLSWFM
jgi:murein DD-endopeptidase MepM/ murein hydrolase activator NlpD